MNVCHRVVVSIPTAKASIKTSNSGTVIIDDTELQFLSSSGVETFDRNLPSRGATRIGQGLRRQYDPVVEQVRTLRVGKIAKEALTG
jgi:tRNA(Phe) wybutosine-synthesizing methylase Tyw3